MDGVVSDEGSVKNLLLNRVHGQWSGAMCGHAPSKNQ